MFVRKNAVSPFEVDAPLTTGDCSAGAVIDTATLVQLVKSKSERGFNYLYDNYCGALYGILMRLVQRRDIADDLLQDVFVKIWKHIDQFDPAKGTLFTWMLNITRNLALDYLRSSGHRNQLLHVSHDLLSPDTPDPVSDGSKNTSAEMNDIKRKVLSLDSKYAEVIDLIFFYGCTHEQTARIMNLPLGTVKTRARKGLGILRNLFQ